MKHFFLALVLSISYMLAGTSYAATDVYDPQNEICFVGDLGLELISVYVSTSEDLSVDNYFVPSAFTVSFTKFPVLWDSFSNTEAAPVTKLYRKARDAITNVIG